MGNEQSRLEENSEEYVQIPENNSEFTVEVQNGPVNLQCSPPVNAMQDHDQVDSMQITEQENISPSQKTIIISPITNGGVDIPPIPTDKSKFRLSISRSSTGPTIFQANSPEKVSMNGPTASQESPYNQIQNSTPVLLETTVTKDGIDSQSTLMDVQTPSIASATAGDSIVIATPNELETTSKPKEISFFDRIFKIDKKIQINEAPQVQAEENNEAGVNVEQNMAIPNVQQSYNIQMQNIDVCNQQTVQVDSSLPTPALETTNCQTILEDSQPAPLAEDHPVMSFFKTLVSPNKPIPKSEDELKNDADVKVVEEQAVATVTINSQQVAPEFVLTQDSEPNLQLQISAQASKDDGKTGKESTPRPRPFWRKSFKEDPSSSKIKENVVVEQPAASISVNSEETSPELILTQETNLMAPSVQQQITTQSLVSDGKAEKESTPWPKPFWKKVVVEPPVASITVTSEEASSELILTQNTNPTESSVQPQIPIQSSAIDGKTEESSPWPRPFWRKVAVEQPVASITVNSEASPELILTQDTNPAEPRVEQQIPTLYLDSDGQSEKESTPWPK
ncbi:hypothetical protein GDO86_014482, partial [Hymenochirus boettgeri]